MIWDLLQARDWSRHTYADTMHCEQVINILVATSSEHIGVLLAIRFGLGMAVAGHVSLPKLIKTTGLPKARVIAIIEDMRKIIVLSGGLN